MNNKNIEIKFNPSWKGKKMFEGKPISIYKNKWRRCGDIYYQNKIGWNKNSKGCSIKPDLYEHNMIVELDINYPESKQKSICATCYQEVIYLSSYHP